MSTAIKISKVQIEELKQIKQAYLGINPKLDELQKQTVMLEEIRLKLSKELNDIRSVEKSIINRIEEDNNVKITADWLSEILNED